MSRIVVVLAPLLVLVLGAKPVKTGRGAKPRAAKAAPSKPARPARAASVAGSWRVDKVIRGVEGALSEGEMRDYLGKTIVIDASTLSFGDRACPAPNLAPRVVPADQAFDDPTTAQKLGATGDVRAVDTTCAEPIAQLLWLSDDRVVFERDGEWLVARRR